MEEIWKFIPNYEGIYKISTLGNIMSIKNGKRKAIIHHTGYFVISLNKNGIKKQYRLHRLIAIAFIDNINNYPQINHINGVKTDNRIENLEWCTAKQNTIHAWEN